MARSLDEILGDHPEPRNAVLVDDLQRRLRLSAQDLARLEAEGYLDPVYVPDRGFMVAGDQAKRVVAEVAIARKLGVRFPPALSALGDAARARFVGSAARAKVAADLLAPYRYRSLERVWSRIFDLATPGLRLRGAPDGRSRSRVGGVPDLPAGMAWPRRGPDALGFIAQIDLADVARLYPASPLPRAGLLSFFYDARQQPWGYAAEHRGAWRVVHVEASGTYPATPPHDLPAEARFEPLVVSLVPEMKLPTLASEAVASLELRDRERLGYSALLGDVEQAQRDGGEPPHRLLGHPDPIQGEMEGEVQLVANGIDADGPEAYDSPEAKRLLREGGGWRLLLQVSSDPRTGMVWGDDGRLYVWMREADVAARRWSDAWLFLQCY